MRDNSVYTLINSPPSVLAPELSKGKHDFC